MIGCWLLVEEGIYHQDTKGTKNPHKPDAPARDSSSTLTLKRICHREHGTEATEVRQALGRQLPSERVSYAAAPPVRRRVVVPLWFIFSRSLIQIKSLMDERKMVEH